MMLKTDTFMQNMQVFNVSLRRKCAAYRRKTNTYAKKQGKLQQRLDLQWIRYNFIDNHFTTKEVPAVSINTIDTGYSFEQILNIRLRA